jgi:PAS domain S-box-containing protein
MISSNEKILPGGNANIRGDKPMKEVELQMKEEHYRVMVENSHDVVYSLTGEGAVTYVSPQITHFGYTQEEIIGRIFLEMVHPDQVGGVIKEFATGNKNGTSFPTQFQLQAKDGCFMWVEVVGKALHQDDGSLLQVGVMRDITKRKEIEFELIKVQNELEMRVKEKTAQLSEAVDKLREAEFHYRTVADFTYDWEYWVNLDGTLQYVSPSCERISGYTPQQYMDNPSLLREIVVPEDLYLWDKHYHDTRNVPDIREMEFRIRCCDGSICWIEHACQPVTVDQRELLGFRASNRDITKRKTGELELIQAYSEIEQLKNKLAAESAYLQEEIKLSHNYDNIIGESDALKYILFRVEQIAPTDTTVLIQGETGTGKELIARAIHASGLRKDRPLIKVNCASLPSNLIESELFGHEKGAFTGAAEKRVGRFELADGATLFLDEIGELPLEVQPKLLRVLQDGEFERLGNSQTIRTNVRIIAATNRNLEEEVKRGRFRKDLWYRLNVFPLSAPPLRERSEDIPMLVNWLVKGFCRKLGKHITKISSDVTSKLQGYSWPGNIRELENVIERAVIGTQDERLQLVDSLDSHIIDDPKLANLPIKSLAEMEQEYIQLALKKTNWQIYGKEGAAELLDLNPSTLRGRMRKYGIQRPPYKT